LSSFVGAKNNATGDFVLHVTSSSLTGGNPIPPSRLQYGVCDHREFGLTPLDLALLSAVVYSAPNATDADVRSWFGPANITMTSLAHVLSTSGLSYSAYLASGGAVSSSLNVARAATSVTYQNDSAVIVVVRGTKVGQIALCDDVSYRGDAPRALFDSHALEYTHAHYTHACTCCNLDTLLPVLV
jgi:hypothetical protein